MKRQPDPDRKPLSRGWSRPIREKRGDERDHEGTRQRGIHWLRGVILRTLEGANPVDRRSVRQQTGRTAVRLAARTGR